MTARLPDVAPSQVFWADDSQADELAGVGLAMTAPPGTAAPPPELRYKVRSGVWDMEGQPLAGALSRSCCNSA